MKRKFPRELADLLTPELRHLCGKPVTDEMLEYRKAFDPTTDNSPRISIPSAFRDIDDWVDLLNRVYDKGDGIHRQLTEMESYHGGGSCFKDFSQGGHRFNTLYSEDSFRGKKGEAHTAMLAKAEDINLIAMLNSESAQQFVRNVTGYGLTDDRRWQVSCYRHGDYVGTHNDLYTIGSNKAQRIMYFMDLHLSFLTNHPMTQAIFYQQVEGKNVFFNGYGDAGKYRGNLALYRLPMWHQVGPLHVHSVKDHADARRWLFMASYDLDQTSRNLVDAHADGLIVQSMYDIVESDKIAKSVKYSNSNRID